MSAFATLPHAQFAARPISRSRDLNDLRDEGYDLEVRSGCLLVKDVPYVNSGKEIKRGILVIKLVLADDQTGKPDTHVAYFSGEYPCNEDGTPIEKIRAGSGAQSLAEGVTIEHTFSAKPKPDDAYPDYHAQVTTYVAILSGPAHRIDPSKRPEPIRSSSLTPTMTSRSTTSTRPRAGPESWLRPGN